MDPRSSRTNVAAVACALAALAAFTSIAGNAARAADPWADAVESYEPGDDANPAYLTAATTLGAPERFTGEGVFPGAVTIFNPPFGVDEIVSIGRGGALVVRFDEPVADDPDNPYGIDLLVFGNAGFIDVAYPSGIAGGLFGADGGAIEVSADGEVWVPVAGAVADGLFPTAGYLDAGPYDVDPGAVESDFTRPVDPALTSADFTSLSNAQILALYDGSGGGAGVDLAPTGLTEISFVRITNAPGARDAIEIDAFADVAAAGLAGDLDRDGDVDFTDLLLLLAAWGPCAPPCGADLDGDGAVGFADLILLLAAWS